MVLESLEDLEILWVLPEGWHHFLDHQEDLDPLDFPEDLCLQVDLSPQDCLLVPQDLDSQTIPHHLQVPVILERQTIHYLQENQWNQAVH